MRNAEPALQQAHRGNSLGHLLAHDGVAHPDALVDDPEAGIQLVLDDPKHLYFDTNWWEEAFPGIVALKLQGIFFNHYHILFTNYLF